ncbi:MAG: SRPBCC family protein, partial [Gillisia sp.]
SFQLKGMPEIRLQIKDTHAPDLVILGSTSPKFDFNLEIKIEEKSEKSSWAQLFFEGNFNAMMAMMVKSPLQKFINTLSENLSGN